MIYPYNCSICENQTEIIKSVHDIDVEEKCDVCGNIMDRQISQFQAIDKTAAADWNASAYNPAFGKHVTPQQAKREAKKKGWTEIGTEPPEKIEKHFADQRAAKKKADMAKINLDIGEVRG